MPRAITSDQGTQIDLGAWARELEQERDRLEKANERRAARRGYLVFATDPERGPDEPGYRDVFATEAKTPGEASAKVRPLAQGRRLRTFLATGTYKDELADARWVAERRRSDDVWIVPTTGLLGDARRRSGSRPTHDGCGIRFTQPSTGLLARRRLTGGRPVRLVFYNRDARFRR